MDDDSGSRRGRVTAGASAMGAAALLVLSFGPSALAVTPSTPAPQPVRASISAPAPVSASPAPASSVAVTASVTPEAPRRTAGNDGTASR